MAAALAVLGGDDVADVAERLGVPLGSVLRWTDTFRAAGVAALTGLSLADEAAVDRYLGMLAHEMRGPLTAATGWVELLGTDRLEPHEQEPARRLVLGRLARLGRLCEDLLDATALRLGHLRLHRAEVDLAAIVAEVVGALGDDRLRVRCAGPAVLVGDAGRLDQIVTNLLTNALNHGGPGPVDVAVSTDGAQVELTVANAGPLRGPVCAERVFEAYEHGCGAGHGLGLYVVRQLVLAHGGTVAATSTDTTTVFGLVLPVEPGAAADAGAADLPAMR